MSDRTVICERARAWAALQPDGELSSFEQRLLGAHLERCAECRAFTARIDVATQAIRAAPLEPLAHPVAISVARRRRFAPRRAVYSTAAAAAAAAMALSIGSAVSVESNQSAAPAPQVIVVAGPDDRQDVRDMRELRRVQLLSDIAPPSERARHFGVSGGA
jgi:ferric-dicitrate binding protein FerR (iron transport regulator)